MNAEELARKIENKGPVRWEYSAAVYPVESGTIAGCEDCIARLTVTVIADGVEVDELDAVAYRRGDEIDIDFCDVSNRIPEKRSHRWLIDGDTTALVAVGYDMLDHAPGFTAEIRAALGA